MGTNDRERPSVRAHELRSRALLLHDQTPIRAQDRANGKAIETMSFNEIREEIYAKCQAVIASMLPDIEQWLEEHPDTVLHYSPGFSDPYHCYTEMHIRDFVKEAEKEIERNKTIPLPAFSYGRLFLKHIASWEDRMKDPSSVATTDERATYRRLTQLISTYYRAEEQALRDHPASEFIYRGANTASEFAWNIAITIPYVWKRDMGRPISRREFSRALYDIGRMLADPSSMRLERFKMLEGAMHYGESTAAVSGAQEAVNRSAFLTVLQTNGASRIAFDNDKLEEWNQNHPIMSDTEHLAFGCPARDIRTHMRTNKNETLRLDPIRSAYQYNARIALRLLAPHLQEISGGKIEVRKMKEELDIA